MAATLNELEARVARLELDFANFRSENEQSEEFRLGRLAKESQGDIQAGTARAFKAMGITAAALEPATLRQRMIDAGIDPAENALSREILAMREK